MRPAQLARDLGVSRQAISDLCKRGVLSTDADGTLDAELARVALANRVRPSGKTAQALQRQDVAPTQAADAPPAAAGVSLGGTDAMTSYHVARTLRESTEARLAMLELAERRGELVQTADVQAAMAAKLTGAREMLLSIADRLAQRLAAESDAAKVHAMLHDEIRTAMRSISAEAPAGSS